MEEKGGFTSHAGVLLSPISRYHNTDVWTFLKPMLMIEHMKMMQMLHLDIKSMLLSRQVPHGTNSTQLLRNGLLQEKKQMGRVWGHTFLIKTLEFFLFFSVPLEIPSKTKLHPWNFGKIMYVITSLGNFKSKNHILHEFFLISLRNFTLFLINPWKLWLLFYKYSLKFYILTLPPCHHLFWNSPISKTLC